MVVLVGSLVLLKRLEHAGKKTTLILYKAMSVSRDVIFFVQVMAYIVVGYYNDRKYYLVGKDVGYFMIDTTVM